tara:strand:- start:429 stop:761 length:333 start_codon:yes stop_codon:yes gene_type:complete
MKKHYVRYCNEWHQINPLIIRSVDCFTEIDDAASIKFYQHDLGIFPDGATNEGVFDLIPKIYTIYENDLNYKFEEIEYGLFNKKGKLIGRMEHQPETINVDTYVMEMKRL